MKIFRFALLAAGLALAAPATAETLRASSPETLSKFFFDRGIPSRLSTDSYGDPLIEVRDAERNYSLVFYGCTDNVECTNLQFYRGYQTDGEVGLDTVNSLNREHRYTRFAIDDEDDVIATLDVLTGTRGMEAGDFALIYETFVEAIVDFEDRVGWVSK